MILVSSIVNSSLSLLSLNPGAITNINKGINSSITKVINKRPSNKNRITCVVKWFNSRYGYGFITEINTENDYFAHQSQLEPHENCFKTLYTGEYIECNVQVDSQTNKKQATNITGIGGGKLMCEHRTVNSYRSPSNNYSSNYERRNRDTFN